MKLAPKWTIALMSVGMISIAQAGLAVGDWFQLDYGTGNGTAVTGTGPANGGQWNAFGGGYVGPGGSGYVDGGGQPVNIGAYTGTSVSGGAGAWQWGDDALGQDYLYLNNGGAGDTNLNGVAVGSYSRMTLFTTGNLDDGLAADQTWDITFVGAGNADGQGLYILLNDGGVNRTGHNSGSSAGTFSDYTVGENYMTFTDVSPTAISGGAELEFWLYTPDGSSGNVGTSAINGIQMQLKAIPEPATLGLVGLFSGGLLFIRRRFSM